MSEEMKITDPITAAPAATTAPEGDYFPRSHVVELRNENKDARLALKAEKQAKLDQEKKFKTLLGLTDEDTLDDSKIEAFNKGITDRETAAVAKANAKLIKAELKTLEAQGYDLKLLDRLLDKSKIEFDENDDAKNLKDLVAEIETEFPAVKTGATAPAAPPATPPANPAGASNVKTAQQEYEELYDLAKKNPRDSSLMRRVIAAKEKLKK